ncbi:amidase signature domain-containing protein [Trichoderma barbatum]
MAARLSTTELFCGAAEKDRFIRSPSHGIPILTKDAIATKADSNSNGWSVIGGQTQSAYIALKSNEAALGQSDPCGSSTAPAVDVSAGYDPLALGTESNGSIVMPGSRAALHALKPALKSVNMDGVFKGSVELDTALTEEQRILLPNEGYRKFLTNTFDTLRIGFLDPTKWSLHPNIVQLDENDIYFAVVEHIKKHAAEASVTHPVDIPPATDLWYEGQNPIDVIMSFEGKQTLEGWLGEARIPAIETIEDIIKLNLDHPLKELPEGMRHNEAVKERMKTVGKDQGIDKLFREPNLNILASPMDSFMVFISAASGYPIATMPAGVIQADGPPYGLGNMAQAGREDLMFQFMSAFEAHFPPRAVPSRLQDDDLAMYHSNGPRGGLHM